MLKLTKDSEEVQYPIPEEHHVERADALTIFSLGDSYLHRQSEEIGLDRMLAQVHRFRFGVSSE